ncbi:MAG: hypothetical protein A2X64_05095 [Ignavibacteria bacterium GWF2_33_9]|nr:MAG: hypothetical protein A2X64_05095 [Ignavibacteria bacterium GWF2_33_9]
MKKIFLIIAISLFAANFNSLFAKKMQKVIPEQKKFEFGLTYQNLNASSFYDLNDSLHIATTELVNLLDTAGNIIGDSLVNYTYDFKKTTIGLFAKYHATRDLSLFIHLPLSFYSLNEKYYRDYSGNRYDRRDLSRTRLDYIELGAEYEVTKNALSSGFLGSIRIPSGFDSSQEPDTNMFLSDGFFETNIGTFFGFKANTFYWKNEVVYNHRAEDFVDQLLVNTYLIFSTVPNTEFAVFSKNRVSLGSYSKARPLISHAEILQDNNFAAGAEFKIMLDENIITKMNYSVTLAGRNTWIAGIFNIYVGFRF